MARLFQCVLFCLLLSLVSSVQPAHATQNAQEARRLTAALNEWRLQIGLPPLVPNPILERMALDQAEYILSLPNIPSGAAIHTGRNGESPRQRALYPQYNWTTFGAPEQLSLSEIASLRPNPSGAINFWKGSDIHNRTVSNATYREVGVAAVPYQLGFVYMVVVGSRPDVLTATADPRAGIIYLSTESYPRGQGTWIRTVNEVRVLSMTGAVLSDWQTWQSSIPIPPNAGDRVVVAYRVSDKTVTTEVSLRESDILLPQYENAWGAAAAPTAVPTRALFAMTNTPVPTAGAIRPTLPVIAPTATPRVVQPTAIAAQPTRVVSSPTPVPVQPTVAPSTANQVTITYNSVILNIAVSGTNRVNVSDMVLQNSIRTVRVANLNVGFLPDPLTNLRAGVCITITVNSSVGSPSSCRFSSTTFVTQDRRFWAQDFDVRIADRVVATCRASAGQCVINF
jgi:uncharacterized protein YkwD